MPYIQRVLGDVPGPYVFASDYMKSLPDLLSRFLPARVVPLGTDGYGMSDTREALRRHFEVDGPSIAIGALHGLRQEGKVSGAEVARAIRELNVDPDKISALSI